MAQEPFEQWPEVGARVLEARERAGLTQSELAAQLRVDRSAVAKIEKGTRGVTALELARLAAALGRPLRWFVTQSPPAVVSRRTNDPEAATTELDIVAEDLAGDVSLLLEVKALKNPDFEVASKFPRSLADAENLARRIREQLGIADEPMTDLIGAADGLGLFTYVPDASFGGVEGAYVAIEGCGVAVVSGDLDSGRRRFTLAHEIGHHVTGDEYSTDLSLATTRNERERLINVFAIHMLMPRQSVEHDWEEIGGTEDPRSSTIRLAAKYRVSWSAACGQLRNLQLIDASMHAELLASSPSHAEHIELDAMVVEDLAPPLLSRTFSKAVLRGLRAAKITRGRAAEMLRGTLAEDGLPDAESPPLEALRGEFAETI